VPQDATPPLLMMQTQAQQHSTGVSLAAPPVSALAAAVPSS